MGEKSTRRSRKQADRRNAADKRSTDKVAREVEQLVWALVDERITARQMQRLETLVTRDLAARKHYIRALQLHADLGAPLTLPPSGPGQPEGVPVPPLPLDTMPASAVRSV